MAGNKKYINVRLDNLSPGDKFRLEGSQGMVLERNGFTATACERWDFPTDYEPCVIEREGTPRLNFLSPRAMVEIEAKTFADLEVGDMFTTSELESEGVDPFDVCIKAEKCFPNAARNQLYIMHVKTGHILNYPDYHMSVDGPIEAELVCSHDSDC